LVYLYHYSNCAEEQLFMSETSKEKAIFILENHYCVYDLTKANIQMDGDIVLKISHIGGIIQTKYEEIIRLIFHTGLETSRQWNGGWSFEPDINNSTPKQSPANSPRKNVTPEDSINFGDSPKYPYSKIENINQDLTYLPNENFLLSSSEIPHTDNFYTEPNENFPDTIYPTSIPSYSLGKSVAEQSFNQSNTTINTSKLRPPVELPPQPNTSYLRFFKPDFDTAYKMEDAKFPPEFSITFECVDVEAEDFPENIWNEELYRNFLNRHAQNKKNQEVIAKQTRTEETEETLQNQN